MASKALQKAPQSKSAPARTATENILAERACYIVACELNPIRSPNYDFDHGKEKLRREKDESQNAGYFRSERLDRIFRSNSEAETRVVDMISTSVQRSSAATTRLGAARAPSPSGNSPFPKMDGYDTAVAGSITPWSAEQLGKPYPATVAAAGSGGDARLGCEIFNSKCRSCRAVAS
ncbi:hypothetical protein PWT90_02377 [Aphanocladium album]|nr:hypothetical protein PWT90_02377 [Aphanocladium album]